MSNTLSTILIIDDDNDIRMISKLTLTKKGGFTVIDIGSGTAALDYLQSLETSDLPDLILLDVMMPDMDGPHTLLNIQKLPNKAANIPVVFLTAKCQPDEIERLKTLGATDVIGKPYDVQKLADQIQDIWRNLN